MHGKIFILLKFNIIKYIIYIIINIKLNLKFIKYLLLYSYKN